MAFPFNNLPVELISSLCDYLDVTALSNLRLASRSCKAIFTPALVSLFKTQSFDLNAQGIQRLCDLASLPDLRHGVRELNLTCVYYMIEGVTIEKASPGSEKSFPPLMPGLWYSSGSSSRDDELADEWMASRFAEQEAFSGADMCEKLSQAFRGLSVLNAITLEATVVGGPTDRKGPESVRDLHWRGLWARSIQAYRVVLSAIARSQVALETLVVYKETQACSIPTHEVAGELLTRIQDEGFDTIARGIKNLSISMATTTTPIRPPSETEAGIGFYEPFKELHGGRCLQPDDPELNGNADFDGVVRFLKSMPNLVSLDIHLYRTTVMAQGAGEERSYQAFLRYLFEALDYPRLRSLSLRCFATSPETLMAIISAVHPNLEHLTLENMILLSGAWGPLLATLQDRCVLLTSVRLSNLWVGDAERVAHLEGRSPTARRLDQANPANRGVSLWHGGSDYTWHTREFGREDIPELAVLDPRPLELAARHMSPSSGAIFRWHGSYEVAMGPPKIH